MVCGKPKMKKLYILLYRLPNSCNKFFESLPWWIFDYCENVDSMFEVYATIINFIFQRNSEKKKLE